MNNKSLLIKSVVASKTGERGGWIEFPDVQAYVQGIQTGDISEEIEAELLNRMVSGVPNPWARAKLFKYAIDYTSTEMDAQSSEGLGLINFYKNLVAEWKGLIACIALYPNAISISEPIKLPNRFELDENKLVDKVYDIPSIFGRMLFEDTDIWSDPEALKENQIDADPFIQLIYYKGQLIGGTSPYTLVFSASSYPDLESVQKMPWYRNGRFLDPIEFGVLTKDQLQKLYLLISNIKKKLKKFEEDINTKRDKRSNNYHSLIGLNTLLNEWIKEIKLKDKSLDEEGSLDADLPFAKPYYELFNIKKTLYAKLSHNLFTGEFSLEEPIGNEGVDYIIVEDAKQLLLDSFYIAEFTEEDVNQPLENAAMFFVKAYNQRSEAAYFPLPLSKLGLNLFQNRMGDLLSNRQDRHQVIGDILEDKNEYKLQIQLKLKVEGKYLPPIVREYHVKAIEPDTHVLMWPNFTSKYWNSYYFYSEFPINNTNNLRAYPFFKEAAIQSQILLDRNGEIILNQSENNHILELPIAEDKELKVERILRYNPTANLNPHKYEVYKSNHPIAGIELRYAEGNREYPCGYLLIKHERNTNHSNSIKVPERTGDIDYSSNNLTKVDIGVDFGSNNTCISFRHLNKAKAEPLQIHNRRVVLIGKEVIDKKHQFYARPYELHFFQNEKISNGQIKSWVHEHETSIKTEGVLDRELAAGVPIFEPNVRILSLEKHRMKTSEGWMNYNLKWKNDTAGLNMKKGFWKTLWLKICAELYDNKLKPNQLAWAYPSALTKVDRNHYERMYREVLRGNPIVGVETKLIDKPLTEAEAVCNYALTVLTPTEEKMMVGIDVGGSTSDILILANVEGRLKLVKQSSIRLAAGYLIEAVERSEAARKAIAHFVDTKTDITIRGLDELTKESRKTSYYLNAIFDRLPNKDFGAFYDAIASSAKVERKAASLFAIPTYICGVILFHAGQLVSETFKKYPELGDVSEYDFFPFGKGSRIFDWPMAYMGKNEAMEYFTDCFVTGMGLEEEGDSEENQESKSSSLYPDDIDLYLRDEDRVNNKLEVALGLSIHRDIDIEANGDYIVGESGVSFTKKEKDKDGKKTSRRRRRKTPKDTDTNAEKISSVSKTTDFDKFDSITQKQFWDVHSLRLPNKFEEFDKFIDIFLFYMGSEEQGIIDDDTASEIRKQSEDLKNKLITYIINDDEYVHAKASKNRGSFSYSHPIVILSAMCFLQECLMKHLFED